MLFLLVVNLLLVDGISATMSLLFKEGAICLERARVFAYAQLPVSRSRKTTN